MLGRQYEGQDCSIARSLEVVGERWTLLVLRDLSFGPSRFDELLQSLGVAPNVLSSRLKRLEEEGLVGREAYQARPSRWAYHLTDKGQALQPVLFHLAKWGDQFYPSDLGPPRRALHRGCGGEVNDRRVCEGCDETVWFDEIDTVPRGSSVGPD